MKLPKEFSNFATKSQWNFLPGLFLLLFSGPSQSSSNPCQLLPCRVLYVYFLFGFGMNNSTLFNLIKHFPAALRTLCCLSFTFYQKFLCLLTRKNPNSFLSPKGTTFLLPLKVKKFPTTFAKQIYNSCKRSP